MLEFINPWFLLALPLAGIPFLLQLVRRQPKVTFKWSSLMLLTDQPPTRRRRPSLTELLLLILRALIILLVVMAFAAPQWRAPTAPRLTWLVVDDSWRTPNMVEAHRQELQDLSDCLSTGYRLGLCSSSGRVLLEPCSEPLAWSDGLAHWQQTYYAPRWSYALGEVGREQSDQTRVVVIGKPCKDDLIAAASLPTDVELWQVEVEDHPFLGTVSEINTAQGPFFSNELGIVVRGMQPPERMDLTLRLGESIVARQELEGGDGEYTVTFRMPRPEGELRLGAQLGDDDSRPETKRFAIIPTFPDYKVFCFGEGANAAAAALTAMPDGAFTAEAASSLPINFASYDLIINLGMQRLTEEEMTKLSTYARNGGRIILGGAWLPKTDLPVNSGSRVLEDKPQLTGGHPLAERLVGSPLPDVSGAQELLPSGESRAFATVGNRVTSVSGTFGQGEFIVLAVGDVEYFIRAPGFPALLLESAYYLRPPFQLLAGLVGSLPPDGTNASTIGFSNHGGVGYATNVDLTGYSRGVPSPEDMKRAWGRTPERLTWQEALERIRSEKASDLRSMLLWLTLALVLVESLLSNFISRRRSSG